MSDATGANPVAETGALGEPDAIRWNGGTDSLNACRAWLGEDRKKHGIDFDHGRIYGTDFEDEGFYGDWFVRTARGVRIVPNDVYEVLYRRAPSGEPEGGV